MILPFDIDKFIAQHVTGRQHSLLEADLAAHELLLHERAAGQSVLVIGGAGSIGAAFIKALLPYRPARLYVIDTNENALTELTRDLRSTPGLFMPDDYKPYAMSFGDRVFQKLLHREGPFDIIAHFAAHKHVRSEKDHYAVEAMIENNVLRTHRLLKMLAEQPPKRFFSVSTDKAANPVNVMGASKKLMEELLISFSDAYPICTARFANVAFSNGSLLDGFLYRLVKRQPLTAPRDIRRFFVSPREAGELCLLACLLGHPGDIYFPKLAEAHMKTFQEIAAALLHYMGYTPLECASEDEAREAAAQLKPKDKNYPVFFFDSDTSGEKPYEEFYTDQEDIDWQRFDGLGVISGRTPHSRYDIEKFLRRLENLFREEKLSKSSIVQLLTDFIPSFHHIETGKGLDQKM
ncbi:MAG: polysaccharide biosynthesis protein [Saprospiraceae bacterium]|nr:polysaccharide biosynthesis protein [Saprospiraceae bacterium]